MAKTAAQTKTKSIYSPHPGVAMMQKWIAELKAKTGRSVDEWMSYLKKNGPKDEKARREWLKTEQGLGTNSAWWLAERAAGKENIDDNPDAYLKAAEGYVEKMFSGGKAGLRPIYDALLKLGLGIGKEAKACPCQTIVPLYRNHVFAQIKPTTRTRIDLGFALGDEDRVPGTDRRRCEDREVMLVLPHAVARRATLDHVLERAHARETSAPRASRERRPAGTPRARRRTAGRRARSDDRRRVRSSSPGASGRRAGRRWGARARARTRASLGCRRRP